MTARLLFFLSVLFAWSAGSLQAAARLEIAPRVEVVGSEAATTVSLIVRNGGTTGAVRFRMSGLLAGQRAESPQVDVPAGDSRTVSLIFATPSARAGVHVVPLVLDYAEEAAPDTALSEAGHVTVAFGTSPPPAVRLTVPEVELDTLADLPVTVQSADGLRHRVRLVPICARSVRVEEPVHELDVPDRGTAVMVLRAVRVNAARPSRHTVYVAAETRDEGPQSVAVATVSVAVAKDPARLPPLRPALLALALLMLVAVVVVEVVAWRRSADTTPPGLGQGLD